MKKTVGRSSGRCHRKIVLRPQNLTLCPKSQFALKGGDLTSGLIPSVSKQQKLPCRPRHLEILLSLVLLNEVNSVKILTAIVLQEVKSRLVYVFDSLLSQSMRRPSVGVVRA